LYDVLHRLHDGRRKPGIEPPSVNERRRSRSPRPLLSRKDKQAKKAQFRAKKRRKAKEAAALSDAQRDMISQQASVTEKLTAELRAADQLDNPADMITRMAEILFAVA